MSVTSNVEPGVTYLLQKLTGTFDPRYPDRRVTRSTDSVQQSQAPDYEKLDPEAEIELRFEFNYGLLPTEPSQLLVAAARPDVAVFQFNLSAVDQVAAQRILPDILFDFYGADQITPQLTLALVQYMFTNCGESIDDVQRVRAVANPLRQFALTLLLGEGLKVSRDDFASGMVGYERIKDLFRTQCRLLYPKYQTLMTGRGWQQALQQYNWALDKVIADEGVAVARGRRPWESTKEAVADAFKIPNRSLTRLETALDRLEALIDQEEYSGRRPDSPVRLRFTLHPLEEQWLEALETSDETAFYEGMPARAVHAIELIRSAGDQGYTLEEVQAVMALLQGRQYVTLDQRSNMLIRRIDNIDDIKEQIAGDLGRLSGAIDRLEAAVAEFERGRFPLDELRHQLEEVTVREEAELLRREIHRYEATVRSFATSRGAEHRERYQREITLLLNTVQAGVPGWLGLPFPASPLQDLLEQQRRNYAEAFETTLREVREVALENSRTLQGLPESPIDSLIALQRALPDLRRASERFKTRLQGYADLKEDLDAWRRLVHDMAEFTGLTKDIAEKYGSDRWGREAADLWTNTRAQIASNPLNLPTLHRKVSEQLTTLSSQLRTWLDSQREGYEQRRQRYEEALDLAGMGARLRIPFNPEYPRRVLQCAGRDRPEPSIAKSGRDAASTERDSTAGTLCQAGPGH